MLSEGGSTASLTDVTILNAHTASITIWRPRHRKLSDDAALSLEFHGDRAAHTVGVSVNKLRNCQTAGEGSRAAKQGQEVMYGGGTATIVKAEVWLPELGNLEFLTLTTIAMPQGTCIENVAV